MCRNKFYEKIWNLVFPSKVVKRSWKNNVPGVWKKKIITGNLHVLLTENHSPWVVSNYFLWTKIKFTTFFDDHGNTVKRNCQMIPCIRDDHDVTIPIRPVVLIHKLMWTNKLESYSVVHISVTFLVNKHNVSSDSVRKHQSDATSMSVFYHKVPVLNEKVMNSSHLKNKWKPIRLHFVV